MIITIADLRLPSQPYVITIYIYIRLRLRLHLRSYYLRHYRNTMTTITIIIRPHRSTTKMRPIATDGVAWSVCLSVTIVSSAKTAEPIEMAFGL